MQYSKKAQEQMMKAQGYAVEIEMILRNIFKCDRFGFGGQINSDAIRKHPFLSMTQGLAFIYATSESKRKEIDKFIDDFSFYSDFSLDELLSFDAYDNLRNVEKVNLGNSSPVSGIKLINIS